MAELKPNLFFGPEDQLFWARLIRERTLLFGVEGTYHEVKLAVDRDSHYNEPLNERFIIVKKALPMFIAVERIEEPSVIDRGLDLESRITVFITTEDLKNKKIQPKEGDIIEIWNKLFNVIDTEPMTIWGNVGQTKLGEAPTLYWRFGLVRRTEAVPEGYIIEEL